MRLHYFSRDTALDAIISRVPGTGWELEDVAIEAGVRSCRLRIRAAHDVGWAFGNVARK
jgi:hypothetical protein